METIIVFSHLRWDFVYQRPQQLFSRLAERHRIVFFEEPLVTDGVPFIDLIQPLPNLRVCRPHTPSSAAGFHDEQLPYLKRLLEKWIDDAQLTDYLVWFYTPTAFPLAQGLAPKALIYDCMDELSAFLNAPRQLLQRETALLKAADLVFTGGPSLYRAKKDRSLEARGGERNIVIGAGPTGLSAAFRRPLRNYRPSPTGPYRGGRLPQRQGIWGGHAALRVWHPGHPGPRNARRCGLSSDSADDSPVARPIFFSLDRAGLDGVNTCRDGRAADSSGIFFD